MPSGSLRIRTGQADQLVNFPIDHIRRQVTPDQQQGQLERPQLRQWACCWRLVRRDLPSTPPGQLAAM
jgi:hypothetical protein